MRLLPLLAAAALLPLAGAAVPAEDDCGLGRDADHDLLVPPVRCEATWIVGDSTDHDHYTVEVAAGDVVFLNVTAPPQVDGTLACLQQEHEFDPPCSFAHPTMRVAIQAPHAQTLVVATGLHFANPPGAHRYQMELDVRPAARATQVEEGEFGPAFAVLTPPFDIPVVPEQVQWAHVALAAPMRPAQELRLTWDRDVPLLWVDFHRSSDGQRVSVDCERELPRSMRCRADDWEGHHWAPPVDEVRIGMPIGLALEWRVEYDHWLDAALDAAAPTP